MAYLEAGRAQKAQTRQPQARLKVALLQEPEIGIPLLPPGWGNEAGHPEQEPRQTTTRRQFAPMRNRAEVRSVAAGVEIGRRGGLRFGCEPTASTCS